VATDGPAFKANLRAGDVIATVAGHPLHDAHDLIRETIAREVGQAVPLEIIRGGQRYGASVTLTERQERPVEEAPSQQPTNPHQGMGLIVRDLAPDQAAQMSLPAKPLPVLTQVAPGSAADRAGLRVGDVIVEANANPDPNSSQVAELAKTGALLLRVKRGDSFFYAALKK
jgi:serine protease Do